MKTYTTRQAADEIGVTTRTMERWRKSGKFLPDKKTIGNHSRYTEKQVKNFQQLIFKSKLKSFLE